MKNQFVILCLLLFGYSTCLESQIFIDYGVGGEGRELMKFFYDVYDQFYVDIGAYDPIFASNTLNLYTMGWNGINIDANPSRLSRFFLTRPDQTNLNYAIGQADKYVTLYELAEDSSSTISEKVKQFVKGYKPVVTEIKIPSLSLKQICERFFYRKPIFMNLDIQGVGYQALRNNDWGNPKCVPDIIISELVEESRQSGLPLPQQLLTKNGYKKQPYRVGLNEVYIHETVYEKYIEKAKRYQTESKDTRTSSIFQISQAVSNLVGKPTSLFTHYQPNTDPVYHRFVKYRQIVDITAYNEFSNRLSSILDRPIVLYHFNPLHNHILVVDGQWNLTKIDKNNQNFKFWQVDITKEDGKKYIVYIFNHFYKGSQNKTISIISSKDSFELEKLKEFNFDQQTPKNGNQQKSKESLAIDNLTKDLTQKINKQTIVYSDLQEKERRLINEVNKTLISSSNTELSIIEKLTAKDNNLEQQFEALIKVIRDQEKKKAETRKKMGRSSEVEIENLMALQNIVSLLIIFALFSICLTVCIKSKRGREGKSYDRLEKQTTAAEH